MTQPPSAAAIAIPLAILYALATGTVAWFVHTGVVDGVLLARPAYMGALGYALTAILIAGMTVVPRTRGQSAIIVLGFGALFGLSIVQFLFGVWSLALPVGVPLIGLLLHRRAGLWGAVAVMMGGVGVSIALGFAQQLMAKPPAFAVPLGYHPLFSGFSTTALVLSSAIVGHYIAFHPVHMSRRERENVDTPDPLPLQRATLTTEDADPEATMELQKLESLGMLAGGIAHDFNNLLVSILGNTSVALMDIEEEHTAHAPLVEVETAAKRARELVGQLLAYAGKGALVAEPLDLNALVREMGDLLRMATPSGCDIAFELCDDAALVLVDPTQVRQVVMNLITNAADAMKAGGGTVTLTTTVRDVGSDELADTLMGDECIPGQYVVLCSKDEGIGMNVTTMAHVFDPFYTTKKTGRGLGLAAVLGIMRRFHGTLSVRSRVGVGTTFNLFFPFAEAVDEHDDLPTVQASTAHGWSFSGEGDILLVDDDPVVLKVTERMVARLQFPVLKADSGAAAIALFREHHRDIQVVLLDMTMPGMDGLETHAALAEIDPSVPVIFTSGYAVSEIPSAPNCTYLQKPYTLKQLTQAIDAAMDEAFLD